MTVNFISWQGLLTDRQHRLGYGTMIDEDFVYLVYGDHGKAQVVAIFDYESAKIKDVRDALEKHQEGIK